ncbi:MAG: hypothetical protein KDF60_19170 [Calditrichaeota bacterium]|nr:hypothetical protein [Calditrichota bacterium]
MKKITRRDFVKKTGYLTLGLSASEIMANKMKTNNNSDIKTIIPMPIQIVIDDVGWWSGEDGSKRQEPYRTGINRNHVPADYQAIADLGKKLSVRPQAATILCEWDRENILRNLPTSTWMREKWDNSKWVGPWLEEAAHIIRNNKDHYELTLHGVGHEYWENENFTRAEWADRSGKMRPLDQVEQHLDYFGKLMEQNQLGSFPASFVPTAFLHGFGVTGDHKISMASVLKKRGIKYINTPFYNMYNREGVQFRLFGMDDGVITVDRGEDLFDWNIFGGKPNGTLNGPCCGLHWPNLLHPDPQRNSEIVEAWVDFLKPYNDKPETILAEDSSSFRAQLVHHVCSKVDVQGNQIEIDFNATDKLPEQPANKNLIIKVASEKKLTFKSDEINISGTKIIQEKGNFLHTLNLVRFANRNKARINIVT